MDGDGSPPPDDVPLNEGDWSPTTEEQFRAVLDAGGPGGYEAWQQAWWPEKGEFVFATGVLDIERVLDPMLVQGRWMDVAGYMRRAFRFYVTEAQAVGAAIPTNQNPIWDIRWTHPELYLLPRAQHALELASQGLWVEAREYLDDLEGVVTWTTENSSQGHGDFLWGMIQHLANAVYNAAQVTLAQVTTGRERTRTAIRDYLRVYLPRATRRLQIPGADSEWQFADRIGERRFRCLVCHMEQAGDLWNVRRHIVHRCRAATASVRDRLPGNGRKRKRRHHGGDPGAGPSSHGGGGGGGGAGAPPGAGAAAAPAVAAVVVGAA
ncbi:hypothetical protein ACP70R_027174 [Stipagrostis hirtigluma subsp. patula]